MYSEIGTTNESEPNKISTFYCSQSRTSPTHLYLHQPFSFPLPLATPATTERGSPLASASANSTWELMDRALIVPQENLLFSFQLREAQRHQTLL